MLMHEVKTKVVSLHKFLINLEGVPNPNEMLPFYGYNSGVVVKFKRTKNSRMRKIYKTQVSFNPRDCA